MTAASQPASDARVLMFEQFEPDLAPHERCVRFLALPERAQVRFWRDLAETIAERREQER